MGNGTGAEIKVALVQMRLQNPFKISCDLANWRFDADGYLVIPENEHNSRSEPSKYQRVYESHDSFFQ